MSIPRPVPAIPDEHRLIDRTAYYRAFSVGAAAVEPADTGWGRDPSTFAPEEYGNYAATSNAVYAASRIRAVCLGKLRVVLERQTRKGWVEVDRGKPGTLFDLTQRVNPFWTMRRLIRMIEWSRCLWGSAYVTLERGMTGRQPPSEMWWVRPDRMRVHPHPIDYIAGYSYEHLGQRIPFAPDEVLWFPLDNPIDEFSGLSPLAAARLSIDTANAALRANRRTYQTGMSAVGMLTPDNAEETWTQSDTDKISVLVRKTMIGEENARALAVWGRSAKFTQFMMSAADMQYIEQLKWSLADVARAYGVPVNMLQDNEHATLANVEQYHKALWSDTILPEAEDIGDVLTEFLVPLFPGEADRIRLDASHIPVLQEDMAEITGQAQQWYSMGVPLNALLAEYNPALLPASGGGYAWGDVAYLNYTFLPPGTPTVIQANVAEALADPETEVADVAEDEDNPARTALRLVRSMRQTRDEWAYGGERHILAMRAFERAAGRNERALIAGLRTLFSRQEESVLARLRKRWVTSVHTRDDDDVAVAPFDLAKWEEETVRLLGPLIEDILIDGAESALEQHGIAASFDVNNPAVREWLDTTSQTFAEQINETTWNDLKQAIADAIDEGKSIEEIAEAVQDVMNIASDSRAETIARTETVKALNGGSLLAAQQSGVVAGKRWLSARDERVRESHVEAHGQERALDEDFDVGGGSGPAPGQIGLAAEDVNCRCTMTWILAD